jgi:threonine dehydratase
VSAQELAPNTYVEAFGSERYGDDAESIYQEVRPRLNEFYAQDRFARLEQDFGVVRPKLEAVPRLHGHHIWRVNQTEHRQNSSYKIHGVANAALVAVAQGEAEGQPVKVLNIASAGNHGEAGALTGKVLGISVRVDMTDFASQAKIDPIENHGAEVRAVHPDLGQAVRASSREAEQPHHVFIPPFNHLDVLTGQAVLGVQLFEDLIKEGIEGDVTVLAAVGGGGHMTGLAFGYRYAAELAAENGYTPSFKATFYGVQMEGGDATRRAVDHYRQDLPHEVLDDVFPEGDYDKTNDGTFTMPGDLTVRTLADRSVVADIFTVSKAEVGRAMAHLSSQLGKKVEPAGALSHAGAEALAKLSPALRSSDPKSQLVTYVSGANVTDELYEHFMAVVREEDDLLEARRLASLEAYRRHLAVGFRNVGLGRSALGPLKIGTSIASSPTHQYRTGLVTPALRD